MKLSHLLPVCALLLVAAAGCQKKQPKKDDVGGAAAPTAAATKSDEIVVGHVGSLTGQEATFGVSTDNGVKLAVEEINAKGGVKGKKLRVLTYDDQGKPTEAAAATTKLILQDRVNVVIGEVASSRSLAMAPIAQTNQVPMISPSSTNPKVTDGKDFVFRVCFIDPFQGGVMARFAHDHLKLKKVAVLRDVRNDYSVGLADIFTAEFKKLGGTIVTDQSYSAGDIDFKAQLTAIRATSPEALWVPGYYTDVGLIARQARELGITGPLLGGDGWDSAKLFEIGGEALEGSYYSNHYAVEDPAPAIVNFIAAYQKRFNAVPDSMAALGYDAVRVAADAMSRATAPSGAALRDAIAQTKGFAGVTGAITLDASRNAVKPAVVLKITGKKAVYQTTIQPS